MYRYAGDGKDGIGHRRGDGGDPRFAHSARLLPARDDVDLHQRHFVHAQHLVTIEISLLHPSVFQGDRAVERGGKPESDPRLHLGRDDLRIHGQTAVDGADHSVDPHLPLGTD